VGNVTSLSVDFNSYTELQGILKGTLSFNKINKLIFCDMTVFGGIFDRGANLSDTKPIFTNLKEKIRAHRASSKATRLILTK